MKIEKIFNSIYNFAGSSIVNGVIGDLKVEEQPDGKIKLIVEESSLAEIVHAALNLEGYQKLTCPLAMIVMIILAKERGYTIGEKLFNYTKFAGIYSYFTPYDTETTFQLVK